MKIAITGGKRTKDFACFEAGEVFRCGKMIAIKVEGQFRGEMGGVYNAIDLETGEFCHFADYEGVEPADAELVIK